MAKASDIVLAALGPQSAIAQQIAGVRERKGANLSAAFERLGTTISKVAERQKVEKAKREVAEVGQALTFDLLRADTTGKSVKALSPETVEGQQAQSKSLISLFQESERLEDRERLLTLRGREDVTFKQSQEDRQTDIRLAAKREKVLDAEIASLPFREQVGRLGIEAAIRQAAKGRLDLENVREVKATITQIDEMLDTFEAEFERSRGLGLGRRQVFETLRRSGVFRDTDDPIGRAALKSVRSTLDDADAVDFERADDLRKQLERADEDFVQRKVGPLVLNADSVRRGLIGDEEEITQEDISRATDAMTTLLAKEIAKIEVDPIPGASPEQHRARVQEIREDIFSQAGEALFQKAGVIAPRRARKEEDIPFAALPEHEALIPSEIIRIMAAKGTPVERSAFGGFFHEPGDLEKIVSIPPEVQEQAEEAATITLFRMRRDIGEKIRNEGLDRETDRGPVPSPQPNSSDITNSNPISLDGAGVPSGQLGNAVDVMSRNADTFEEQIQQAEDALRTR